VGGHGQGDMPGYVMLLDEDQVLKPLQSGGRGRKEAEFYELVFNGKDIDPKLAELRQFLTCYTGIKVHRDPVSQQDMEYLSLHNICHRFRKPCVLDLKMGRQTWAPYASAEKARREFAKYPTQDKVGFRFVGMKVYKPASDIFKTYERNYGYQMTEDRFPAAFDEFLNNGTSLRKDILPPLLIELRSMLRWFESQHLVRFYSSSILIVFEGDCQGVEGNSAVAVKMIDFSHVVNIKEKNGLDDGYIFGLQRLIAFLKAKLTAS